MKTLVKPENIDFDEFLALCETVNCSCKKICKDRSYADEDSDEILF